MNEEAKRGRDDRRQRIMLLIDDCLGRGIVLDEVEVDGMRLHISSMPRPQATEGQVTETVEDAAPQHPVSYRTQAREALMRRRAERTSS